MEALSAEKLLVSAPLLRWYVDHGAVITAVYRTINYTPGKVFDWLVEQVTEARRTGDAAKSKALLAEVFKLLGNSGYRRLIEALEWQTNVIYTKDEKVVDKRTSWKAESLGSQSDGRSRSESLSTSSESFECLNFIRTFLTGISTEETSS